MTETIDLPVKVQERLNQLVLQKQQANIILSAFVEGILLSAGLEGEYTLEMNEAVLMRKDQDNDVEAVTDAG